MKARILNIALAFAVILSLSCCGVGDEILNDESPTETTSEAAETTEELTADETTYETTTEAATETTTEETEEVTSVETTLTIPDEETILASLTDEEKEVWLSMPDIVTMRMLMRWDDDNFLYTEIVYIDKMGQIKKIISPDKPESSEEEHKIEWLNDQIRQNEDAELSDVANIHTLIKFYNTFICVDNDSKWIPNYTVGLAVYIERHYWFEIYGIRNDGKNGFETIQFADGDAGYYYLRRNKTNDGESSDKTGRETVDLYLKLDPFMVDSPGGIGHLVGEEG